MRIGPVIVLLLALCDLVACGSAQSTSSFQSVSGQRMAERFQGPESPACPGVGGVHQVLDTTFTKNPITGKPIYTYVVSASGEPYYFYADNTGKQVTSHSSMSIAPSNGWITA